MDHLALLSLLGGDTPQDLFLGMLKGAAESLLPGGQTEASTTEDTDEGEDAAIFFIVRGGNSCRRRVVESLRQEVPAELVKDILIGGRSWREID
jgi:hypothetical protein